MSNWEDNLGDVYEIRGVTYTIIGSTKEKCKTRKYILRCKKCSKDEELWPYGSISCTKGNLLKGQLCCGCSPHTRWSETQNLVRMARLCKKFGYTFHGWCGEYSGDKTYLDLENPRTDNRWSTTSMNNLLHGYGDPKEGRIATIAASYKEDEYHIKGFLKSGVFPDGTEFTRISSSRWQYTCGNCGGKFSSSSSHLKRGKMSCACNGRRAGFNKSKLSWLYVVRWLGKSTSHLKFGITNRDYLDRIKLQQYYAPSYNYQVLHVFRGEGTEVYNCESSLREKIERCFCGKEDFPDGYTETVEDIPENLNKILEIIKTFNLSP